MTSAPGQRPYGTPGGYSSPPVYEVFLFSIAITSEARGAFCCLKINILLINLTRSNYICYSAADAQLRQLFCQILVLALLVGIIIYTSGFSPIIVFCFANKNHASMDCINISQTLT